MQIFDRIRNRHPLPTAPSERAMPGRRLGLAALLLLVAGPTLAQQAPAPANPPPAVKKPDACFKSDEVTAEAQVRTGIQLREILRRCAEFDPEGPAALKDWYAFDSANATQIKNAVTKRRAALLRIYPNLRSVSQWETDSAVATMKSVQVNDGVCKATYDVMAKLKKEQWKGFQYYAKLQESLLAYEIPECRK
jgi:hypothetical protein